MKKQSFVIWMQESFFKNRWYFKDIAKEIETRYYEVDRLLPTRKNKKVIGLMKNEYGQKRYDTICWIKSKNKNT